VTDPLQHTTTYEYAGRISSRSRTRSAASRSGPSTGPALPNRSRGQDDALHLRQGESSDAGPARNAVIIGQRSNAYSYANNNPISFVDPLGLTAESDGSGVLQSQYTYEPYGGTAVSGESDSNSTRYTGRESDGNGLYYYRARYYDPAVSRFIQSDPIGLAGGINTYVDALDSPLAYIDPTGTDIWVGADVSAGGLIGYLGVGGNLGAFFNWLTGETCFLWGSCVRIGPGIIIAGGYSGSVNLLGPHCGKDLNGANVELVGELVLGEGGLTKIGIGKGSGGVSLGPDYGAGAWVGLEVCNMRVIHCFHTPSDCQRCKK
jgi:RHS repeat-associated protein